MASSVRRDIRVMTSGGFAAACAALLQQLKLPGEMRAIITADSIGSGLRSIPNRLSAGEPADVVIASNQALVDMAGKGLLLANSLVPLARSVIGAAVRSGMPRHDIRTPAALTATLLKVDSIAYSSSVSGHYLSQELVQRLGIADRVLGKMRCIRNERVGAVVARGEADIGFQQMSELLPIPGIDILGPLPDSVQKTTLYAAGVASGSMHVDAARRVIRFLASPQAITIIEASGLAAVAATRPTRKEHP